jgi:hypothetical protein
MLSHRLIIFVSINIILQFLEVQSIQDGEDRIVRQILQKR